MEASMSTTKPKGRRIIKGLRHSPNYVWTCEDQFYFQRVHDVFDLDTILKAFVKVGIKGKGHLLQIILSYNS
jgi:hypothetical protein